ncbi:ATPase, T2SS/T4P/T4SS family [Vibrio rotiferianus]|uniref:ATPase, T2SS/T4P/T4SS family n=1 Tax=Vibrio rotiferianus TaxID=190895 RepID=UPI0005ED9E3A|nr:ATPase, T2SS/T4P/T4SS family [Vibrio rotiferianus]
MNENMYQDFCSWWDTQDVPPRAFEAQVEYIKEYKDSSLIDVLKNKNVISEVIVESLPDNKMSPLRLIKHLNSTYPNMAALQRALLPAYAVVNGLVSLDISVGSQSPRICNDALAQEGILEECREYQCLLFEFDGVIFHAFSNVELHRAFNQLGLGERNKSKLCNYITQLKVPCFQSFISAESIASEIKSYEERAGSDSENAVSTELNYRELARSGKRHQVALGAILQHAVAEGASDIHISPNAVNSKVEVRIRVGGSTSEIPADKSIDLECYFSIRDYLSRVSDATPNGTPIFVPTDGRTLSFVSTNKKVRLRTTFMPLGTMSEIRTNPVKIVMRVIPFEKEVLDLQEINLSKLSHGHVMKAIYLNGKIFFIFGPVGAGKSTTLYSSLKEWKAQNPNKEACTIEDPIEQLLEGVMQVEISTQARQQGIGHTEYLKGSVRGDLDALIVSEVRDLSTLTAAMEFSAVGSKIMTTMHAADEIGGVQRAMMMLKEEDQKFLLLSNMGYAFSQRLVPILCGNCKKEFDGDRGFLLESAEQWLSLGCGKSLEDILPGCRTMPLYQKNSDGCKECDFKGVIGRQPVMGVLEFNRDVVELLMSDDPQKFLKLRDFRATTLQEEMVEIIKDGRCELKVLNI